MISEDMTGLDPEVFREIVAAHCKGEASPEIGRILALPVNADRWYLTLVEILQFNQSVLSSMGAQYEENQVLSRQEGWSSTDWHEWLAQHKRKRAGVIRFLRGVEAKIPAAKQAMKEANVSRHRERTQMGPVDSGEGGAAATSTSHDLLRQIRFYRAAIHSHKEWVTKEDFEPTLADEALWRALDGEWDFDRLKSPMRG